MTAVDKKVLMSSPEPFRTNDKTIKEFNKKYDEFCRLYSKSSLNCANMEFLKNKFLLKK